MEYETAIFTLPRNLVIKFMARDFLCVIDAARVLRDSGFSVCRSECKPSSGFASARVRHEASVRQFEKSMIFRFHLQQVEVSVV